MAAGGEGRYSPGGFEASKPPSLPTASVQASLYEAAGIILHHSVFSGEERFISMLSCPLR